MSEEPRTDGRKRPEMIERRNDTIRKAGAKARGRGMAREACPYVGWQGGYRKLWLEGYDGSGVEAGSSGS